MLQRGCLQAHVQMRAYTNSRLSRSQAIKFTPSLITPIQLWGAVPLQYKSPEIKSQAMDDHSSINSHSGLFSWNYASLLVFPRREVICQSLGALASVFHIFRAL